eukprot:g74716.t1
MGGVFDSHVGMIWKKKAFPSPFQANWTAFLAQAYVMYRPRAFANLRRCLLVFCVLFCLVVPLEVPTDHCFNFYQRKNIFPKTGYLYFQHIHKCGGSTVCHLLRTINNFSTPLDWNCLSEALSGEKMRYVPNGWNYINASRFMKAAGRGGRVLTNEDGFVLPSIAGGTYWPNWVFLIVLRNPIERVYSHYRESVAGASQNISFLHWLRTATFFSSNYQTRVLLSDWPLNQKRDWHIAENHMSKNLAGRNLTRLQTLSAMLVLYRFIVCVTEDMEEVCLPQLRELLGVASDNATVHNYRGNPFHKYEGALPPASELKVVEQLNQEDLLLHTFTKDLSRQNLACLQQMQAFNKGQKMTPNR